MNRRMEPVASCYWPALLAVFVLSLNGAGVLAQQPIIIGHDCIDLDQVPDCWVRQAKTLFRISYGHTSHGSQPITGTNFLKDPPGSLFWWDYSGTQGGLSLHDGEPAGDLGHNGSLVWEQNTRNLLETPGCDRTMIIWSWCGGVSDNTEGGINIYLNALNQLEIDYPAVTFVYMTGHLDGGGEMGNLHIRNNQIRDYCIANNKILFDFADIESYDPDGNYYLDMAADDQCYYWDGGLRYNWAIDWCALHTGSELCAGDNTCVSCGCAHSVYLNCNMKGRAFWWMLARAAGWDGTPQEYFDEDCNGVVDLNDFAVFADCLAGPGASPAPMQTRLKNCLVVFDVDLDFDVDLGDFGAFQAAFDLP